MARCIVKSRPHTAYKAKSGLALRLASTARPSSSSHNPPRNKQRTPNSGAVLRGSFVFAMGCYPVSQLLRRGAAPEGKSTSFNQLAEGVALAEQALAKDGQAAVVPATVWAVVDAVAPPDAGAAAAAAAADAAAAPATRHTAAAPPVERAEQLERLRQRLWNTPWRPLDSVVDGGRLTHTARATKSAKRRMLHFYQARAALARAKKAADKEAARKRLERCRGKLLIELYTIMAAGLQWAALAHHLIERAANVFGGKSIWCPLSLLVSQLRPPPFFPSAQACPSRKSRQGTEHPSSR